MKECKDSDSKDWCYRSCVELYDFGKCMRRWRGTGNPQCVYGFGPTAEKYADLPKR